MCRRERHIVHLSYGKEPVIDKDMCIDVSDTINSLSHLWTEKVIVGHKLHILGVSGIADGPSDPNSIDPHFINYFSQSNSMLLENFGFLYSKLIDSMNKVYGECSFMDGAPLPGFFIYGGKEGFSVSNPDPKSINVHIDNGFDKLEYLFKQYKEVDHSQYIAVTLSIKLPSGGSGLIVWDQPDIGLYSKNKYSDFIKSIDFASKKYNNDFMKDNVKNYIPELIEYRAGDAVYIDSKIVHAVSHGVDIEEKDQRITMQAFGIKCDGVWRLIF